MSTGPEKWHKIRTNNFHLLGLALTALPIYLPNLGRPESLAKVNKFFSSLPASSHGWKSSFLPPHSHPRKCMWNQIRHPPFHFRQPVIFALFSVLFFCFDVEKTSLPRKKFSFFSSTFDPKAFAMSDFLFVFRIQPKTNIKSFVSVDWWPVFLLQLVIFIWIRKFLWRSWRPGNLLRS